MKNAVVSVLMVGLLGCQAAESVADPLPPARSEQPAPATPVSLPAAKEPEPEPELAPVQKPGLLSLLTLGAAVIGAVATPSRSCSSDACFAASIIDRTAQLDAATNASFAKARARRVRGSAQN